MIQRTRSHRFIWLIPVAGLTMAIGFGLRPAARADVPTCGKTGCPNCPVNSKYFGYYPTLWRRWPGTEPIAQPTPGPATEGVVVPNVQPPLPGEETEPNKTKSPPPETPAGAGGASAAPADPNSKPPAVPGGNDRSLNRLELPSPDAGAPGALPAPMQINRLRPAWGNELAPTLTDSLGPVLPTPGAGSGTWPPPNYFRSDERRASFQTVGGSEKSKPIPDLAATGHSPSGLALVGDASNSTLRFSHENKVDSAADSLRWVDPTAGAHKAEAPAVVPEQPPRSVDGSRPAAVDSSESPAVPPSDAGKPLGTTHDDHAALEFSDSAPSTSSRSAIAARIPFVPSPSIHESLAPLEPQALTGATAPTGRTPADAQATRLTPPSRVGDIPMPAVPRQSAALAAEPAPVQAQESLSRIDPLAIGKALEKASPRDAMPSAPQQQLSRKDLQLADGVTPQRTIEPVQAERLSAPAWQLPCYVAPSPSPNTSDSPCGISSTGASPAARANQAIGLVARPAALPLTGQRSSTSAPPPNDSRPPDYGVSTADFEIQESAMPAKPAGANPQQPAKAPGTGFPPQTTSAAFDGPHAATFISDDTPLKAGNIQPATYSRPFNPQASRAQDRTTPRSSAGEALSTDAAMAGSTNVSDSTPSGAAFGKPLNWGK